MAYVTRQGKGERLSIQDLDGTLNYLFTASLTPSSSISASYAATASYVSGVETPIYIEIPVSSSQILNMVSNPIEILPDLSDMQYYEIDKITMELSSSIGYTHVDDDAFCVYVGGRVMSSISKFFLEQVGYYVHTIKDFSTVRENTFAYYPVRDTWTEVNGLESRAITLSTYEQNNEFTTGNGTILVKIWYKVRTFGSEL
jgi:hypothetical protein